MPKQLTLPLVGAFHRPPAKFILEALPAGSGLRLQPDPGNPYDPKAIQVWIDAPARQCIITPVLKLNIEGSGMGFDEFQELTSLMLGFLPDSDGKVCAKLGCPGNREARQFMDGGPFRSVLGFDIEGKPTVILTEVA